MVEVLDDRHLHYPEAMAAADVAAAIKRVLDGSDEALLKDPRLDLDNYIMRVCWIHQVHPFQPLLALQREQGLVADNKAAAGERAWDLATGVVGQHVPGQKNDLWNGLCTQILLSVRTTAWLAGIGPEAAFGNPRLRPSAHRWMPGMDAERGKVISLLNLDGSVNRKHTCCSAMEYAELAYTPDARLAADGRRLKVRALNADVFNKFIAPRWG
jgi:hypothetical protein